MNGSKPEYKKLLVEFATRQDILKLATPVLENVKFLTWTGSGQKYGHHYGNGGLLKHTYEVIGICLENNEYMELNLDVRLIFLAGLYHDYCKIYDYVPTDLVYEYDQALFEYCGDWENSEHKYKIHHIAGSAIYFNQQVKLIENNLTSEEIEDVTHAILAHHQLKEWGSPVQPKTKLAWLLHLCDSLSARMDELC